MAGADGSEQTPDEGVRLPNRDRRPEVRKTERANMPVDPTRTWKPPSADEQRRMAIDTSDSSAGGGRGFDYEWERRDAELKQDIVQVAAGGMANHTHEQTVPALVWTIDHNLGFIPSVIVVDAASNTVIAEVRHPSTNRTVIVHGQPFAGTAYLRI